MLTSQEYTPICSGFDGHLKAPFPPQLQEHSIQHEGYRYEYKHYGDLKISLSVQNWQWQYSASCFQQDCDA